MGLLGILCGRVIPFVVLVAALIVGWFASHEQPLAVFFATVVPLSKGHMPPSIVGHGKMKGTPPVPDDMKPKPRPAKELFLELPGSGDAMPQNGIGMCCRYSAYDDVLVYRTTLWYLLEGGRHIDGASMYLNHQAIGKAVKEAIARGIPRKEIFITTKIPPSHFGYETAKKTVPNFLKELGVDYIDLVLMHAPAVFPFLQTNECGKRGISNKDCRQETWKALSELKDQGLLRNIGVSNFAVKHLQELDGLGAPVANNQIQYSPFVDASEQETLKYCAEHNISVTAYSPLGGLMEQDKAFTYGVLNELAAKYDKSVSQIMLRWAIQRGTAVIPGTGNPKHMIENLQVYDFELSAEDFEIISGLKHAKDAPIITPVNQMVDMD